MHDNGSVNRAFSAQASHYDKANLVIKDLRKQVYSHVALYMKPNSRILELNAGTGIDASYFIAEGHSVLATDISDGMINELHKKAAGLNGKLSVKQVSFDDLGGIGEKFDYVFSNFGGLNCIDDLKKVTRHIPHLLNDGGYVTWVIMPPVHFWEQLSIIKGNKSAFRRLKKEGVMAHVDGEHFRTWYHSLSTIRNAIGEKFELVRNEGLAAISPPPHRSDLPRKRPGFYNFLRQIDNLVNGAFPFDRCADHIVVTFRMR